jgi:two-component system chemotaxis response regulator CheY
MADQDMTVQTMPSDGDQPKSVLIVDDSQVMRNMLAKFFTDNGFNVVGMAEDGVQAIELFEQLNPDIMTLDIIMPKMRGTEVLETIMARYPEAKVVMASSVSDARTVMKCLKIGAKQYILKPYDEQKVMTAIKKALEM